MVLPLVPVVVVDFQLNLCREPVEVGFVHRVSCLQVLPSRLSLLFDELDDVRREDEWLVAVDVDLFHSCGVADRFLHCFREHANSRVEAGDTVDWLSWRRSVRLHLGLEVEPVCGFDFDRFDWAASW